MNAADLARLGPAARQQVHDHSAAERERSKQKTAAVKIPQARSKGEAELELYISLDGLPKPRTEYRFHARKWRFDFAWPDVLFAVEVEGVTAQGGRHQRIDGFQKDLLKYEAAMMAGWQVYRCSPAMISNGQALMTIRFMLERLGAC